MTARLEWDAPQRKILLVVTPETIHEAMLLEVFLRYDANIFSAVVTRATGRIVAIDFDAGSGQ